MPLLKVSFIGGRSGHAANASVDTAVVRALCLGANHTSATGAHCY